MTTPATVVFTRAGLLRGAWDAVPLSIGTVPFGLVVGIAANGAGLSLAECELMSILCFAGSAQLVALTTWSAAAPIMGATLGALVVNLRLALMGPVLAPWLDRLRGWRRWGSLFVMADQNWALSVREMNRGGGDAAYLLGSGGANWIVWAISTLVGHEAGALLRPPPGHPIFFAALAVFLSMLVTMWRGPRDLAPWAIAAGVAVAMSRLFPGGSWHIVAGALAGSVVGGLRDRR